MLLAAAALVLLLPGAVWELWLPRTGTVLRDFIEGIADAIGLSVALTAIAGMIFFFTGGQFSGLLVFILFSVSFVAVAAALLLGRGELPRFGLWGLLLFFLVLGGALAWRFYQARTLMLPAWVDSVHHVLVTQKIIDAAGIPATLAPELDVRMVYHYGFHILAAMFAAITRIPAVQAVLWLGQVLSALIGLGIYRLVRSIWQDARAALLAALLVTFAFQMPAYYLTWGRYTLITGLLVLLPAMAAVVELLYHPPSWQAALRLLVLTAGLALVHYMALLFLGLWCALLLLERFVAFLRQKDALLKKERWRACCWTAAAALGGILLSLPWLLRMLSVNPGSAAVRLNVPDWQAFQDSLRYILYLVGPKYNHILFGIAAAALVPALIVRRTRGFALWALLMAVLSVPWGLRLGPFRPDHMAIVLFIPASVLLGGGLVWLADWVSAQTRQWVGIVLFVLLGAGALAWGGWQTRDILNPVTVLADAADAQALDWIAHFIPEDARFFANTTVWQYNVYRGVDGAYWITPITRRFSLAMPGLYGYAERETVQQWQGWMERAGQVKSCDADFWALVQDAGLDHLYLHQGRGTLQPTALSGCTGLDLLYQVDGVEIYKIHRSIPDS